MKTFLSFVESMTLSDLGNKRESPFLFGKCRAFAHALHSKIGGEVYELHRNGKFMHSYVHKDGHDYDVLGKRHHMTMARKLSGTTSGWTNHGPVSKEHETIKPSHLEQAHRFIEDHKKRFT